MSTQTRNSIIGSWVIVLINNRLYPATVVDASDNKPKRVRVQRGDLQGEVFVPSQYEFKKFIKDVDVDE